MLLNILTFAGRLHPLIVHLPIGFLLLAVLFNLLSYSRYPHLKSAVPFTLLVGFIAAILACVFGYLLSLTGDYDHKTLGNHKIAGITLAVVAGLLWLLTTQRFKGFSSVYPRLFSLLLIGLVGVMGYTGHQGGSLTHGHDYLNLGTLTQQERKKPVHADEALIFEDVVHPILVKKCGQCHQAGKLKGKLSVQHLQSLLKGGKSGPAIVAGKPEESELYKRITLDPHNEKFMPADGKPPLARMEVEIIRWWIAQAMATEGKKLGELKDNAAIRAQVASFLGLGGSEPAGETVAGMEQPVNPEIPPVLDMALVAQLREKGLMVRVMLQKPVMLDVTLPAGSGIRIDGIKASLMQVAKNIIWLNLSDNGLTEKDLDFLKLLSNMEKLRLEKNPIADGISDHLAALQHLEAVNLNETKISAVCLNKLGKNTHIKRIYSWRTGVE